MKGAWDSFSFLLVNRAYLTEKNIQIPSEWSSLIRGSLSTSFLYDEKSKVCVAVIQFEDSIRSDALALIEKIKKMNASVTIATGDHPASAQAMGQALGIADVRADMRPENKVNIVKTIQANGSRVVMVGDGINDSLAMSAADISFTFSHATSLAQVSAAIVLNDDRLMTVWHSLALLKKARQKISQNYMWAFLFNAVMIPFAACGNLSPMWASASMALSSLIVIGNSMLLRGVQNDQL